MVFADFHRLANSTSIFLLLLWTPNLPKKQIFDTSGTSFHRRTVANPLFSRYVIISRCIVCTDLGLLFLLRFLEVLEAGCIPVLLANDWELPFSEVIDWSQAAVLADERTFSRLPVLLRNIPGSRIIQMREKVRFIWNSYFRSIDAIVNASLMVSQHPDRLSQQIHPLPPAGNISFC